MPDQTSGFCRAALAPAGGMPVALHGHVRPTSGTCPLRAAGMPPAVREAGARFLARYPWSMKGGWRRRFERTARWGSLLLGIALVVMLIGGNWWGASLLILDLRHMYCFSIDSGSACWVDMSDLFRSPGGGLPTVLPG